MDTGRRSAAVIAGVVVLAVVAGVVGFATAPRSGTPAVAPSPSPSPTDVPVAGALVTVAPGAPAVGARSWDVAVVADSTIESVVLRADGEEVDRFEPSNDVRSLRTQLRTDSAATIDAVATLRDGRTIGSTPVRPAEPLPALPAPTEFEVAASASGSTQAVEATPVEWEGPGRLDDGVLTVEDPTVGRVFLYITDDGLHWHRVPALAGTSVPLLGGQADLSGQLPRLDGRELQMELWRDDENEVAMLGVARATVLEETAIAEALTQIGLTGRVDLGYVDGVTASGEPILKDFKWLKSDTWQPLEFQWSTDVPGVTHVIWQAFDHLPIGDPNPLDNATARTGVAVQPNFTFVPPGVEDPDAADVRSGTWTRGTGYLTHELVLPDGDNVSLDRPSDPLFFGGSRASLDLTRDWYVRVLAFAGDNWLGKASDIVRVHRGTTNLLKQPPPVGTYDVTAEIIEPTIVDPTYRLCYEVVTINDLDTARHLEGADLITQLVVYRDLMTLQALRLAHGDTLCVGRCYTGLAFHKDGPEFQKLEEVAAKVAPPPWSDLYLEFDAAFPPECDDSGSGCDTGLGGFVDTLCDAGAGFANALHDVGALGYSVLQGAYNGARDEIVDKVVEWSGCSKVVDEEYCKAAANVAADVALASVGLPPRLPSTEALIEGAKGDLADLLVEIATEELPCGELAAASEIVDTQGLTCEEFADKIVEEAAKLAANAVRGEARDSYGMPFPPGVEVIPDRRGNGQPLRVRLTVTPEEGRSLGPTCAVDLSARAEWLPPLGEGLPFHGLLDVQAPGYFPTPDDATHRPWRVPPTTQSGWYADRSITFPRPPDDQTSVSVDVILAPPAGLEAGTVTGHRLVAGLNWSPQQPTGNALGYQWWDVPADVMLLRPGARIAVLAVSACANGDLDLEVLGVG
ncbi:MAG: hypothetical protein R3249_02330 [Nitriliruptorales bacterium]|nr:hypothetical protein [Nitriliruptorales bacterium]